MWREIYKTNIYWHLKGLKLEYPIKEGINQFCTKCGRFEKWLVEDHFTGDKKTVCRHCGKVGEVD